VRLFHSVLNILRRRRIGWHMALGARFFFAVYIARLFAQDYCYSRGETKPSSGVPRVSYYLLKYVCFL